MNKILKGALVVAAVIAILGLGAPVNLPLMLDEDDMVSDDDTCVVTQQSIKAYSDSATQTMTNKTLTSPALDTSISGTAFLDEDNMASDSASKVASQQSIKKYVDDVGTWTTWSPTWTNLTVGNGTVIARYVRIGNFVYALLNLTWGSTTSIDSPVVSVSLPVTAASGYDTQTPVGTSNSVDATGSEYGGHPILISTTETTVRVANASGTYLTAANLSSTVPFTWTTSDQILLRLVYEAAP